MRRGNDNWNFKAALEILIGQKNVKRFVTP